MITSLTNMELGLRADIHLVALGYAVSLVDTDAAKTVSGVRIFPLSQLNAAIEYAQRLVADD